MYTYKNVFAYMQLLHFTGKNSLQVRKIPLPGQFYLVHTFTFAIFLSFLLNRTTTRELLTNTTKKVFVSFKLILRELRKYLCK